MTEAAGVTGAVAVVGGGIAGIQAALDLAEQGFKVYLLEEKPSIGGHMAQLDKTFPTLDCSICIEAPKMVEAARHPNIEILTGCEPLSLEGTPGNFKLKVLKRARLVAEDKCRGCGSCAEACRMRSKLSNEFDEGRSKRSAIYLYFAQAVPMIAAVDPDACLYVRKGICGKVTRRYLKKFWEMRGVPLDIDEREALPACETACEAEAIDFSQKDEILELNVGAVILATGYELFDPSSLSEYGYGRYANVVTAMEFERMICASGPFAGHLVRPSDGREPKSVAFIQCVGSRDVKHARYCSAVCCMFAVKEAVLLKEHYPNAEVYIFYVDLRAFGKGFEEFVRRAAANYGINFVRARPGELEEDAERNIVIWYEDTAKGELRRLKVDLAVLCTALLPHSVKLKLETDEDGFVRTPPLSPVETSTEGVYVCGFASGPKDIPESVAQASAAAAKAAARLSAARGSLVTEKELPPEVDISGKPPRIGVFICHCGTNIAGVLDVKALAEYVKKLPGVVFTNVSVYTCSHETNELIKKAIDEHDLNRVVVAACTPRTHEPLFQNTLTEAGLNPYLFEFVNIREQCSWTHARTPEEATEKAKDLIRMGVAKARLLKPLRRGKVPVTPVALVIGGGVAGMTAALDIAEQGFRVFLVEKEGELGGMLRRISELHDGTEPSAILDELVQKVERHERIEVLKRAEVESVQGFVGNFKVGVRVSSQPRRDLRVGVIVIATGAELLKPHGYCRYGEDEQVMTQLEFEKILADAKQGGESDAARLKGKTVVMIQCVGARNDERPYCGRICCVVAVKNAIRARQLGAKVYVLYKDMRTYGKLENLYLRAKELGVVFIRCEGEPTFDGGALKGYNTLFRRDFELKPDFLVLSTPLVPCETNERLSEMLRVPLDSNGFFLEAHMKLRPVDFATDGIFLCGTAHSPKLVEECISQASAAAARACIILSKEEIETEGIVARVDVSKCVGCGLCVAQCAYGAISLEGGKAKLVEALCKGCGTCVAACPTGALEQGRFENAEIAAQVKGLFELHGS